jgi:superfamily II DNA or RNA helicase
MACRIKLDTLTDEHKKIIREKLCIQPKTTNFAVNKFSAVEKDPILFYWIDKPNNEIVLPYTFANCLFGKHINSEKTFPAGKYSFKGNLRDYQIPLVDQAMKHLTERGTTLLNLSTGAGKTLCSIVLGSKLLNNGTGGLVLILVNRETIQKGWEETIKNNTDAGLWIVDSKMKIPTTCNIILCMEGRFGKIPKEIVKMISVVIIDEMHLMCTCTQVPVLLGTCPKYIICNTATPERTDGLHVMMLNMIGTHKVEMKADKHFTVYKLCTGIETEFVKNKQGTTDFSALTRDLSMDPKRNTIILNCIQENPDKKILVLSWSVEHCHLLHDVLKARGQSVDILAGNKSKYIDSRILIGTVSKISTGFDCRNVSENFDGIDIQVMILCGSTKSHNIHIQSIGRSFRSDNPIIVDIVDENSISKRHWTERKKNYLQMNCDIKEIHISENIVTDEVTQESLQKTCAARLDALRQKLKEK